MVKVIFEQIDRSYYDNSKKELHLRENLIGNKEDLTKVLEHETEHIRIDDKTLSRFNNKYADFLYEWLIEKKFILWVILIPISTYLQFYTTNWVLQKDLNLCNAELFNATRIIHPIITNLTFH